MHASVRGTGCSSGEFDIFSTRSALDGREIIDGWIAQQPWSNGSVGLVGHSYGGITGTMIAETQPAHLVAISVSGLVDDLYRGHRVPGWRQQLRLPAALDARRAARVRHRSAASPRDRPSRGCRRRSEPAGGLRDQPAREEPHRARRPGAPRPERHRQRVVPRALADHGDRPRQGTGRTSSAPTRTSRPDRAVLHTSTRRCAACRSA